MTLTPQARPHRASRLGWSAVPLTVALLLSGCSAVEPSGTVRVDEKKYRAAVERLETMREDLLASSTTVGGTAIRRGAPGLSTCGQVSGGDDQQELVNESSFLVPEGGPSPEAIEQRLEEQLDERWTREEDDRASTPGWTSETAAGIELRITFWVLPSQDTNEPGTVVTVNVSGSCMHLSDDLREKIDEENMQKAESDQL